MTAKTKGKATSKPKASSKASTKPGTKASSKQKVVKHEHGAVLTTALVIMALHGIVAAIAYNSMSTAPEVNRPWIISLMVLHSLLDIVAAVAIYYWKQWGLYLYVASMIIAMVAGLVSVGFMSVFYIAFPLVILGYLLRYKWDNFG